MKTLEIYLRNLNGLYGVLNYYGFQFCYSEKSPYSDSIYENWVHPQYPHVFEIRISDHYNKGIPREIEVYYGYGENKNALLRIRKHIRNLIYNESHKVLNDNPPNFVKNYT